jgi:hypothetical protein
LGQCTDGLQAKLKQQPGWAAVALAYDALALFDMIASVVFDFEDRKYQPLAMRQAKLAFLNYKQSEFMTNSDYYQGFENRAEVAKSHHVVLYDRYVAVTLMKNNPAHALYDFEDTTSANILTEAERDNYLLAAEQICLAICFLDGSDKKRFGRLLQDLENDYTKGLNNYPDTLVKAYKYLNDYKVDTPVRKAVEQTTGEVAFVQHYKPGTKEYEDWVKDKICFNCGKPGHLSPTCPDDDVDNDETTSDTYSDETTSGLSFNEKKKKAAVEKEKAAKKKKEKAAAAKKLAATKGEFRPASSRR